MQKFAVPSLAVLIGVTSFLASSCSKQESAQAQSPQAAETPTVAVAKAATGMPAGHCGHASGG